MILEFWKATAISIGIGVAAATAGVAASIAAAAAAAAGTVELVVLLMLVLLSWNVWSRRYINKCNISSTLIVKVSTYANKMFIHTQKSVQHK